MKKIAFGVIALVVTIFNLQAKPVSQEQTRRAAANFWNTYRTPDAKPVEAADLTLVPCTGLSHLHIYAAGDQGYVILSSESSTRPVLAYSFDQPFPAELPPAMHRWLEFYEEQLEYIKEFNPSTSAKAAYEWDQLLNSPVPPMPMMLLSVSPLCTALWDQTDPYNRFCPFDSIDNDRAVVGCVATAMAQIMKRWEYPAFGAGSHSYEHHLYRSGTHRSYGTISADFGQTTYHWENMTNSLDITSRQKEISAIGILSFHCGVAVDMQYGTINLGGSGAYTISYNIPTLACSEFAMRDYFKYDSSILGVERRYYNDSVWKAMIDSDLALGRPILYTGDDASGSGHAFVLDGSDTSGRYHFNWGWSGSGNGYFVIDSLNIYFNGTGSNPSHTYNLDQSAVFHIFPRAEERFIYAERYDTVCNNGNIYYIYDYELPMQNGVHELRHLDTILTLHLTIKNSRTARFLPNGAEEDRFTLDYCPVDGLVMPECPFTRQGYVFLGWCMQSNASDSIYRTGQVAHITHNAIFYAIWRDSADAAGIDDIVNGTSEINLFPNPTTGRITVDLPNNHETATAVLFDALGRMAMQPVSVDGRHLQIDLSTLPQGIYTLQLRTSTAIHNSRVIKQ